MERSRDRVEQYFSKVDEDDIDWILNLFASDAVYERDSASTYKGLKEISVFFREIRPKNLRHTVLGVWEDKSERTVFAIGIVSGVSPDGSEFAVRFGDYWQFNEAGSVELRRSYLAR